MSCYSSLDVLVCTCTCMYLYVHVKVTFINAVNSSTGCICQPMHFFDQESKCDCLWKNQPYTTLILFKILYTARKYIFTD